jgi:hypothetical protein
MMQMRRKTPPRRKFDAIVAIITGSVYGAKTLPLLDQCKILQPGGCQNGLVGRSFAFIVLANFMEKKYQVLKKERDGSVLPAGFFVHVASVRREL